MKKILTLLAALLTTAAAAFATDEGTGIYLSGSMNSWAENDPAWELKAEPETPGWAYIDLNSMPAGTQFRVVGHGRNYGMKNDRNTIRQNSEHLMTLDGANNLVVSDETLDGVHFMVQLEGFTTDKYIGLLTINEDSHVLYGACMQSSVTPTLLVPDTNSGAGVVGGYVEITEPFYIVKAYSLSNATQTVNNYGLSDTEGLLQPTSNLSPSASPVPVPADGTGEYLVCFNTDTYAYSVGENLSVGSLSADSDASEIYYNLQGIRTAQPDKGSVYIRVRDGKVHKVLK